MKKLLFILLAMTTLSLLSACTQKDDLDLTTDTPVQSLAEIQGSWFMRHNAYDFTFTFTGNVYHLEVINHAYSNFKYEITLTNLIEEEDGYFLMEGNKLSLIPSSGTTKYETLEAYWDSEAHRYINFLPLGSFYKQ